MFREHDENRSNLRVVWQETPVSPGSSKTKHNRPVLLHTGRENIILAEDGIKRKRTTKEKDWNVNDSGMERGCGMTTPDDEYALLKWCEEQALENHNKAMDTKRPLDARVVYAANRNTFNEVAAKIRNGRVSQRPHFDGM